MLDLNSRLIQEAHQNLGASYALLQFADQPTLRRANERRAELLVTLGPEVRRTCWDTKLHHGALSPGCRRCMAGRWSCLFVNARCGCGCFFCPGQGGFASAEPGPAVAEGLTFDDAQSYATYALALGYDGVSFSGGDPLLTFDRVLGCLQALKRGGRGERPYVWLYSGGAGASDERLAQLAAAGLDEIRFNVAARGYDLDAVERAVGRLPTVTVEIPVIPDDAATLLELVGRLDELGVDHLHLHELMALGSSPTALAARGYTFVHGPHPPVLGSELVALELLASARSRRLRLGVHYCSGSYKRACHAWAPRARLATAVATPLDSLTRWGHVRAVWAEGDAQETARARRALSASGARPEQWRWDPDGERLMLHPALLATPELGAATWKVQYLQPFVLSAEHAALAGGVDGYRALQPAAGPAAGVLLQPISPVLTLSPATARALAIRTQQESARARGGGDDPWPLVPPPLAPELAAHSLWESLAPGLLPYC